VAMNELALSRANGHCELCASTNALEAVLLAPKDGTLADDFAVLCDKCSSALQDGTLDENHLRCLNDSMWSTVPAAQIASWRLLAKLADTGIAWANDLLEMMYLDDEMLSWAKHRDASLDIEPTLDANGVALAAGDNVVLIKDLPVKGAGFTAKRGTPVRGIGLTDNPKHIQGRVNGQQIIIIAAYVKK